MHTQCPTCHTVFRILPTQIKARAGTVRCGQCHAVFNALETLADDPVMVQATTAPAQESLAPMAQPVPVGEPAAEEPRAVVETVAEDEMPAESAGETETDAASVIALPALNNEAAAIAPPEDYLVGPAHQTAVTTRRWPWRIGSILALLCLLAQATYYYRVELAVLWPNVRPVLQALCEPLQCTVPRPRSIDTLGIDASDLRPEPQQPGHLTLTATLRSKAVYAQEWPQLELTLTDIADQSLAVKHFSARDYLPKGKDQGQRIAAGFPAHGEIAIVLPLDVGKLPAVGYRLYIFYP